MHSAHASRCASVSARALVSRSPRANRSSTPGSGQGARGAPLTRRILAESGRPSLATPNTLYGSLAGGTGFADVHRDRLGEQLACGVAAARGVAEIVTG